MKREAENRKQKQRIDKRMYTVEEAAIYLGRSTWSMRHLLYDGKISFMRDGRRIFLRQEDLEDYIECNMVYMK